MVRKISSGEYGKRLGNMTAAERHTYQDRVGQWLRSGGRMLLERADDYGARLQNVLGASVSWNDRECEAFEEGASLLSVLAGVSETWLPDVLYSVSARRAIRQMFKCLKNGMPAEKAEERGERREEREERKKEPTPALPKGVRKETQVSPLPVRPKHIDQYVHLLPKKTQERAGQVRELLRDLDVARENARKLMDAGEQGDKVAQWAKKATSLDDKVRSIYKELDAEWEKLVKSGRIVVDMFGNASVAPEGEPSGTVAEKSELTSEQKHRRRELRKWLTDTRRGAEGKAREKRIEQWKANIREYLTLEPIEAALKDKKLVAAAKHYGIEIQSKKSE